jgi:hypothetical protein
MSPQTLLGTLIKIFLKFYFLKYKNFNYFIYLFIYLFRGSMFLPSVSAWNVT